MNPDPIIAALAKSMLAAGAAVLMVLPLRWPVRRVFGAGAAYALWWCVPAAMLAVLLPARRIVAAAVRPELAVPIHDAAFPAGSAGIAGAWGLLALWLSGALLAAVALARRQRRFVRGLGALHAWEGSRVFRAERGDGLPALVGLLRPRIVVPHDFAERYTADERRLVLAHEWAHLRRGDGWANAAASLLLCVHWFNPLLHLAMRRFRLDQELACDALVVASHPTARKAYGSALLKTQVAGPLAPVACQWAPRHPLKERIAMLKRKTPSRANRMSARALVLGLWVASGYAAWAQQPARVVGPPPGNAMAGPASNEAGASSRGAPPQPSQPPRYPAAALKQAQSGKVMLLIDIDAQGVPTNVRVESSQPKGVFDAAAIEAAYKWRLRPETRDGQPVAGRVRVPVSFDAQMQPVAAPAGHAGDAYAWYRVNWDPSGKQICDLVLSEPGGGPDAPPLCGIRKVAKK